MATYIAQARGQYDRVIYPRGAEVPIPEGAPVPNWVKAIGEAPEAAVPKPAPAPKPKPKPKAKAPAEAPAKAPENDFGDLM